MPQASREIQRRLKSVRSIKKITRAMELVAASKMRKSVSRVVATRPYADAAWRVVMELIPKTNPSLHPLLAERPVKKAVIVVISSNRGLCGAFNLNVVHKATQLIKKEGWREDQVDFMTFGKKGAQVLASTKHRIVADYPKNDITAGIAEIVPISSELITGFMEQRYDEVCLAYTDFRSSLRQEPRIRHLLPLVKPSRFLGQMDKAVAASTANVSDYLFEPSRNKVLEAMLPRLIEVQIFQAVLESEASEHSARMLAMRNATDSATDMLDTLTLAFNQARQASITAELAEISAASAAVR